MLQSKQIGGLNGLKKDPYMFCLQKTNFRSKDTHTESKRQKKIFHVHGNENKSWASNTYITILDTDLSVY